MEQFLEWDNEKGISLLYTGMWFLISAGSGKKEKKKQLLSPMSVLNKALISTLVVLLNFLKSYLFSLSLYSMF